MKIRTISGACFVAILTGFFLLRQFVDYRLFQILIGFFLIVGAFEIARALKDYLFKGYRTLAIVFACVFLALYGVMSYIVKTDFAPIFCIDLILVMAIITAFYSLFTGKGLKEFGINLLPFVYPALTILALLTMNDLTNIGGGVEDGFIPLLMSIAIACASDTFAYLVGMTYNKIRKGNVKKLCPKLSPKKTVAGAIGGLVGGAVGAIAVYFIFMPDFNLSLPVLFFIILGIVASVVNIIGDLFESLIKRKVGIKDMGKIMPGHGGVLDRIDGLGFVAILLTITFLII